MAPRRINGGRYEDSPQGRFYERVFQKAGLTIVLPHDDNPGYIHQKHLSELPLILRQGDGPDLPFPDTTAIHVQGIVRGLL